MTQDQLTELFTFQMTASEKELLRTLAHERGATISGTLRKLIRDAVWKYDDRPSHLDSSKGGKRMEVRDE